MGSTPAGLFMHLAAVSCQNTFLGLKAWYYYLQLDGHCQVINFTPLGANSSVLLILLAIIDDLLRIAGLLAVIFVIVSGVKYMTSQGSPDGTAKALSTLINALIGLAMSVIAIAFVAFLGSKLGGNAPGGSKEAIGLDLSPLPNTSGVANGDIIKTVLSIVFSILGAAAFMLIVIGGFKYVGAHGDPQGTAGAKRTIIYALVGLTVTILAQVIVSVVAGRL